MLILAYFLSLTFLCSLLSGASEAQSTKLDNTQSPPHTTNKSPHSDQLGDGGKATQSVPPVIPTDINIVVGGKLELASSSKEPKVPEKQTEWFSEFFKIKLTDLVIAIFTVVIGIWTICLTKATRNLATISEKQEKSTRIIERAYVKMSHMPPGLVPIAKSPLFDVRLRIRNFGQTPANVTNLVLAYKIVPPGSPLPTIPEFAPETDHFGMRVFLVKEDEFFTCRTLTILAPDFEPIQKGDVDLCVYGYVDYIDQFETRHRAGYARRYDPRGAILGEGSNLNYITEPNYNYDRERNKGEGNDWNEPI